MQQWLKDYDKAVERLIESIHNDMVAHGDILSRETIRLCDELQLVRSRRPKEAS